MAIVFGHSFLVHPAKNDKTKPEISAAELKLSGRLHEMLSKVYHAADDECDTQIVFQSVGGEQKNPCRDLFVNYMTAKNKLEVGQKIAVKLQDITTHRSGLGLLFLVIGKEKKQQRLLIARFPADQGISAEARGGKLLLSFIEQVFLKSAKTYKSVLYASTNPSAEFWDGWAIDKQHSGSREQSDYWIGDFLESELRTTAAQGTQRLAEAMKEAIKEAATPEIRDELWAAAQVIRNQSGNRITIAGVADVLKLTPGARNQLRDAVARPELLHEKFKFDQNEYDATIRFKTVELDNGAMLSASNADFDDVFKTDALKGQSGRVRLSTEGRIVKKALRKARV